MNMNAKQAGVVLYALLSLVRGSGAPVEHVVVVGCDGLSPDGVRKANAPVMHRLMREGAWTLRARAVMPTSSSPNWASMIMGAGPEQHGVTSNDWQPDKFDIAPTVIGPGGIFPTLFSVLREQRPGCTLAVFHDWDGFGRLFERRMVDVVANPKGPTNTLRRAIECLKSRRPTLIFIQIDHVDHAGHEFGYGTPQYYAAVAVADQLISEMVSAIQEAGIKDSTLLLVTSDHGGKDKGHGGATMTEIEVPWILTGPGVRVGHEIQSPVNIYDTAATLAFAMALKPPEAWIARPVMEAFARGKN
jgi:predicted AlkP superfamily pyrophosphatase or phosphodiesterase